MYMDWLSWLFPRRCIGCKELGDYICPDCINRLVPMSQWYCPLCRKNSMWGVTHARCKTRYSIDGLISCYPYKGLMIRLITRFKYSFIRDLANTLVELMISAADYPCFFKHQWTVVPVPLHPGRKRWRGFNQAEVLARGLSHAWEWPLMDGLLIRIRATKPQMRLSGKRRKDNLRGAFDVKMGNSLPRSVLLVDDVATTCSTLNECARVLKRAGVSEVWGLTLAQTLPT